MNIVVTRVDDLIYTAVGDAPYWEDGSAINERLAFNDDGSLLSSFTAQSVDRKRGQRYILVNGFSIKRPDVREQAKALKVGESFTFQPRTSS